MRHNAKHPWRRSLFWAVVGAFSLCGAVQAQSPQEVPPSHWAYGTVQKLAAQGMIQGYPRDKNLFAGRIVTRYEMASIVQRVLNRFAELSVTPGKSAFAAQQSGEVQNLVNEFRVELTVIGSNLERMEDLLKRAGTGQTPLPDMEKPKETGTPLPAKDAGKPSGGGVVPTPESNTRLPANLRLTGYIQTRFDAMIGDASLFPDVGGGGTGQRPTIGAPGVGGASSGFLVRRGRLKFEGKPSPLAHWQLQIDAPSISPVNIRDAFLDLVNFPAKNLTFKIGQFVQPFGYELIQSSRVRESPERSMGFSETTASVAFFKSNVSSTGGTITPGSALPLFVNQDRDIGAMLIWAVPAHKERPTNLYLGVFNGEGRDVAGLRNLNQALDVVGRAETVVPASNGKLYLGLSGYYGHVPTRSGPPTDGTPAPFRDGFRLLAGTDIRYETPRGHELRFEYIGGIFETTPDRAQFLENNHVEAWYLSARQPITSNLSLALKYEELYPVSQSGKTVAGLGRGDLARKILSAGLLYQLDKATRLRLWYGQGLTPYDPSASAGPLRSRLGLLTFDVQVEY